MKSVGLEWLTIACILNNTFKDNQAWYIYWILKSPLGYVNMCFSGKGNPTVWWIMDIVLNCLSLKC